jgi:hypothetical protein
MAGARHVITEDRTEDGEGIIEVSGEGWAVVNGVTVLSDFVLRVTAYGVPGVELRMGCQVRNGIPRCTSVEFAVVDDQARDVPPSVIRDFKMEDMLEFAVSRAVSPSEGGPEAWARMRESDHTMPASAWTPAHTRAVHATRAARKGSRSRYTDDLLRQVAVVYHANLDQFPTRAVRSEFNVSESTAQTYVRKAREAGHITETAKMAGRPASDRS